MSEEWPSVDLTDPISIVLKGDDVYGEGLCDKPHFRGDSLKAVFRIVVCVCVCMCVCVCVCVCVGVCVI